MNQPPVGRDNDVWERWDEVDRLFDAALDLPTPDRDAFLRHACAGDDELLAAVRRLLAATDTPDQRLDGPGAALLRAAWTDGDRAEPEPVEPGRVIDRYRILRELGRGGMATVYEAERADGAFEQRVAVKLIRRGLDTDEVVRRFIAERQILSGLEHPNIARLIDGGATDDGRPYLVMERVAGQPIVRWADRNRLTIQARLRLFLQVADAVQFAHQRLIIHRDLKPSNVLVDDTGHAKLLDFGIAKLLARDEEGPTDLTRTGLRPLTPAFASPEQVRGDRITTASDVYQLGLLLYMLLAGRRPFGGRGAQLEAAIAAGHIERPSDASVTDPASAAPRKPAAATLAPAAVAQEPMAGRHAPSTVETAAATHGADPVTADEIAAARCTTPEGLRRVLRGDLDAIIMMALRTEPDRRYASAADLAEDVNRYLARQPVLARPDTIAYRARRFASRRPGVVAATLLTIFVNAAYIVTLNVQAQRLAEQRDVARTESDKARIVSDFLVHLFESNNPNVSGGETPTAFDLLERGEARVDSLDVLPPVKAQMLGVMGQMYALLGRYDRAEPVFRETIELNRAIEAEPTADLAMALDNLGDVLQRTGQYDEAESVLREAIETARLAGAREFEADGLTDLGHARHSTGNYIGAEEAHRQALAIRREVYEEARRQPNASPPEVVNQLLARTAGSLMNLAVALESQERFDEAEQHYLDALETQRAVLEPEHSDISLTLTTLARLYIRQGRLDEADPLLRQSLEATRTRLGPTHIANALTLNELGTLSARRRDWPAAERFFRDALQLNEATLGPMHMEVAANINNISYVMLEQGRLEEAVPLRQRALDIAIEAIGTEHQNTGIFAYNLAFLLDEVGRDAEAEPRYRQSLSILRRALPQGHALLSRPLSGLGDLMTRNGRAAEAEPMLREAIALRKDAGEPPAAIADLESMLGACLAALGHHEEAERLLVQSLATLEQTVGDDSRYTRNARERLTEFRQPGGD